MYLIIYILTIINLLFQIIYCSIGNYTEIELENMNLDWVFSIFRAEYMIFSGIISFLICLIITILLLKSLLLKRTKRTKKCF